MSESKAEGYLTEESCCTVYVLTEKGKKKMEEIEHHLKPIDQELQKLFPK